MAAEDALLFRDRTLEKVRLAPFFPLLRAEPVSNRRVEIFGLHEAEGLLMAEIMSRTVEADIRDDIERQGSVGDFDAANTAQALPDHVIVDDQAFETE